MSKQNAIDAAAIMARAQISVPEARRVVEVLAWLEGIANAPPEGCKSTEHEPDDCAALASYGGTE